MYKEKVLSCLRKLGFQPEFVDEDFGYRFFFEELTMLYTPEDDNTHSISLSLPNIYDITDDNRTAVLEAMPKLCAKMRYVQPSILFNNVWLNYQHYLEGNTQPSTELLEHMIHVLAFSMLKFKEVINNEDED